MRQIQDKYIGIMIFLLFSISIIFQWTYNKYTKYKKKYGLFFVVVVVLISTLISLSLPDKTVIISLYYYFGFLILCCNIWWFWIYILNWLLSWWEISICNRNIQQINLQNKYWTLFFFLKNKPKNKPKKQSRWRLLLPADQYIHVKRILN